MAELKLTKTELRVQQVKLSQLQKYLPTLQLKKTMLQIEVNHAEMEVIRFQEQFTAVQAKIDRYAALFSTKYVYDFLGAVKVQKVCKHYENIAGIEVPVFEKVLFEGASYAIYDTPVWLDTAVEGAKELITAREKIVLAKEKQRALSKELREVSIRVNLFEKIMIPRAVSNIKKIKIFLGDQQLAAVSQAKVSKRKILEGKEEEKKR